MDYAKDIYIRRKVGGSSLSWGSDKLGGCQAGFAPAMCVTSKLSGGCQRLVELRQVT